MLSSVSCSKVKEEPIPAKVAGTFYPADASDLSGQIEYFFMNVPSRTLKEPPVAIWVPHAGLQYSGQMAAVAYYEVKGRPYDTAILVGPSHYQGVKVASIYPKGRFQTPLGEVPIDEALAKKIQDQLPDALFSPEAFAKEHSLEVQLPFLQKIFPKIKVVAILMGPIDLETDRRVAEAIAKACQGRKVLLVASSDMSHYPRGADAEKVDENSLNIVKRFDAELLPGYSRFLLNTRVENLACLFCGDGALATVMEAAKILGANECSVLGYTNSARVTGQQERAVGYGAAAFYKNPNAKTDAGEGFFRQEAGRKEVLALARRAIETYVRPNKSLNVQLQDPEFFRPRRVFITLKKEGQLRGCVGNPNTPMPLYEAVIRMAMGAAFNDGRFQPVTEAELPQISVEASVLENFQRVKSADAIVMGKHGVIVRRGDKEGLFLPEVAEMLPDKEQFLSRLCEEKAGLPPDAWKDPQTELWTFTTTHFSEV